MSEIRRTMPRRVGLINKLNDIVGNLDYNNQPIGYCLNGDCSDYKPQYHKPMKDGMLEDIEKIENIIRLIKMSVVNSNN